MSVQVYHDLPVQRLSGYSYDIEDLEPYPCYPELLPVPEPEFELDDEVDVQSNRRSARSYYLGPPDHKTDVYSIFKVGKCFLEAVKKK